MNIIFMGTPDFAVPSLKKLIADKDIEISAVVTQPDRKSGRGQNVKFSAVKKTALDADLKVMQTDNVNNKDFLKKLSSFRADFVVVVAFGQKLGEELLNLPRYGCINLHASLLPEYRGSSPIHKAIIEGEKVTGNTTMYMGPGWDDGDIIYQQEVEIKKDDTVGKLHDKLAENGAELLVKTLDDIKVGSAPRIPQDEDQATFAYKIDKELGRINWEKSAEDIYNLVRGVNPWPGAYSYLEGERIKIWWVEIKNAENSKKKPGTIIKANIDDGILVQTGDGIISIEELQIPGGTKISSQDFLNGHQLEKDQKFN
jgi:methionyl-tRNA formyltransferase